jgi:hypothetical protein
MATIDTRTADALRTVPCELLIGALAKYKSAVSG